MAMSSLLSTDEVIRNHAERREKGYEDDIKAIRQVTRQYCGKAQYRYGNTLDVEDSVADAIGSGTWSQCMNVVVRQRIGDHTVETSRDCPVVYYKDKTQGETRKAGIIMPDGSLHELKGMYRTNAGITSFTKLSPESERLPNGDSEGLLPKHDTHAALRRIPDLTVDFMSPEMSGGEEVNKVSLSMEVVIKPEYIRNQYDPRLGDQDVLRAQRLAANLHSQLEEAERTE